MTNFKKYYMLIILGLAVISLFGYSCVGSDGMNADTNYILENGKPIDYSYKKWPMVGYGLAVQRAPHKGGGTDTTTVFQMVYMDSISFHKYDAGNTFPNNTILIMEQPEALNGAAHYSMTVPNQKPPPDSITLKFDFDIKYVQVEEQGIRAQKKVGKNEWVYYKYSDGSWLELELKSRDPQKNSQNCVGCHQLKENGATDEVFTQYLPGLKKK